jgi:hypothetical protein
VFADTSSLQGRKGVPRNPTVVLNLVTDAQMREDLRAAARQQDRSISSIVRAAVRAWLSKEASGRKHPEAPA